jgi:hypothetical protein
MSLLLEAGKRARRRSEASLRLDLHGMQLNGGEPIATNSDALDDKTVVKVSTHPGAHSGRDFCGRVGPLTLFLRLPFSWIRLGIQLRAMRQIHP